MLLRLNRNINGFFVFFYKALDFFTDLTYNPIKRGDSMSNLGNKAIMAKNIQYYMDLNKKSRNDICKALGVKYTTFTDWVLRPVRGWQ